MQNEYGLEKFKSALPVLVRVKESEIRFTDTFVIGRGNDCDVQIADNRVSRRHAKIEFDGERWMVRDMGSVNGTYLNGVRIQDEPLPDKAHIKLGNQGPVLSVHIEREGTAGGDITLPGRGDFSSETQIIRHYLNKSRSEEAGEHTRMFQRAFERVHKRKSRKYLIMITVAFCLLVVSAGIIMYQKNKINKLRSTAENIFYAMKSLELQIANIEEVVLLKADPKKVNELRGKREKFKEMEKNYDNFVKELGIYGKMTEEERIILRVARRFGECEINMPRDFSREVSKYIGRWKTTDRLKNALARAKSRGYTQVIEKVMNENNLPPQYFFLALQESDFNERTVGPLTRYGYAKGVWQFIPATAHNYGLQLGPMYDKAVYDPADERFDFAKATMAAGRYIRDINNTEAQASGLLVMASYNWGENNVNQIIRKMPRNPRERNFWKLLQRKNVPEATYNYVFYIVAATVICDNPRLFNFDGDCPVFTGGYK